MRKILFTGVALSSLFAGSAMAADLPVRAPAYKAPPPVVAYFSWTGCYVGANVGWAGAKQDANEFTIDAVGFDAGPGSVTADNSGAIGGVHAGCNYQAGAWVFGLEGDYSWTNLKGTQSAPNTFFNGTPVGSGSIDFSESLKSLASIRGRIGIAVVPTVLLYLTAGGAWNKTDYTGLHSYVTLCPNCSLTSFSSSKSGWVAGGGAEAALWNSNWIARAEALYYSFGGVTGTGLQQSNQAATTTWNWDNQRVIEARVGISYKFGGTTFAAY